MDLTTATPVEIDTVLARIMGDQDSISARIGTAIDALHYAANDKKVGSWGRREWEMATDEARAKVEEYAKSETPWVASKAQQALDNLDNLRKQAQALREEAAPLNAEFRRRGGWTRAFLSTSSNGHIHSSRNCSTCYSTTQYFWFVDLSGHDEAEIVAKAGSDACTVCYPTAPVNDLKRPRSIFSDDEKAAQKAREEREQAKADRLAKRIANGLTEDGSEFVVEWVEKNRGGHQRNPETGQTEYVYRDRVQRERFKTEAAAVQWVVRYITWGDTLDGSEKSPAYEQIIEAVAAKHNLTIEEVREDVSKKVVAKMKRDAR